ncbi:MAG: D-alanyl-lipoteichoic acid biosynthesis protein DltB [Phycisphaeraceae bacterium]
MIPTIDLASAAFWLIALVAVVVLTPITHARLRRWVFAAINLLFIAVLLRVEVVFIALMLIVAWGVLHLISSWSRKRWIAFFSLLMLLVTFVLHKLPSLSASLGTAAANPLLVAIGFSYVFLRLIDAGRVVYEAGRPPPGLPDTVNYLVPFHMLAAGPIQSYEEFIDQPAVPEPVTAVQALVGIERIALGLFKKYVVAYLINELFLTGFHVTGPYMFFEVQMHYLWFYLDFSGYSDIAVGLGKLMGIRTPENFDRPYLARNMIDFWDRWHISLSQWVRRNLFIPIQLSLVRRTGGRHALLIATIAFTVSFLLCGLWHGINWPYFAWGAMHALGLVVTNAYRHALTRGLGTKGVKAYKSKVLYRLIGQVITFEWVAFSLLVIVYPWKELWS